MADSKTIRPIAIYLPQFHPVQENDAWWGKGFTEWTNVSKAKPLFKDHYQPHLPTDLGFYDLRVAETREAQAALAKEYGIHGFCYYHYWFNGRRILERPFNEVLSSGKPDFPFCLCWANENWTRRWDGMDKEVLLEQKYGVEDNIQHMKYLCSIFKDKRYIRINGKPLFIVYRIELFPDIKRTAEVWRQVAREEGIGEIYLAFMQNKIKNFVPEELGFDAAISFEPNFNLSHYTPALKKDLIKFYLNKVFFKLGKKMPYNFLRYFNYQQLLDKSKNEPKAPYKLFPGITPMWDNSARRKKDPFIIHNSTPELYQEWFEDTLKKFEPYSADENFIFINAWNEWAEGNHLEPDQRWGRKYLEATLNALKNTN